MAEAAVTSNAHQRRDPPTGRRSAAARTQPAAYGMLTPFFLLYLLLMVWPLIDSLRLGAHGMFGTGGVVGPGGQVTHLPPSGFWRVLVDGEFWGAFGNTTLFAMGSLLTQIPLALGLALLTHHRAIRARAWVRAVFFMPVLVNGITLSFIAMALFDTHYGLVNQLIQFEVPWTTTCGMIMPTMILMGCWKWSGLHMLFFLAGLQSVRKEELEAAEIDGASAWQRFWHITLPALKPYLVFVITLSLIGSFQLFELPYILTLSSGGVADGARTVVQYLYEQASMHGDRPIAAAAGWVLTLVIVIVTALQWRVLNRYASLDSANVGAGATSAEAEGKA